MDQVSGNGANTTNAAWQLPSTAGSSSAFGANDAARDDSWKPLRERLRPHWLPQDDDKRYTMHTLFRQHHGEFMDRRERYDPDLELRVRTMPNQRLNDEPGSFDLLGYDFDVEAPVLITTEAYLLFGLYQYGRRYQTSSGFGAKNNGASADRNFGDDTLTAAGARIGLGWFLHPDVLLEIETNPGVYSDLEDSLTHKDFDWPSSALVTVRTLDNFFFKFGARYNQIFEDAPWLPYLGFSWEIVDGVRLDVLAPEMIELSLWPTDSTAFSLGTMVQGAQYHVHSTGPASGKQSADVQVQEVITYVGMTHRFSDHVSLSTRAGIVVAGEYDLSTGAANFDRAEGALDQGFYADITFGIDW